MPENLSGTAKATGKTPILNEAAESLVDIPNSISIETESSDSEVSQTSTRQRAAEYVLYGLSGQLDYVTLYITAANYGVDGINYFTGWELSLPSFLQNFEHPILGTVILLTAAFSGPICAWYAKHKHYDQVYADHLADGIKKGLPVNDTPASRLQIYSRMLIERQLPQEAQARARVLSDFYLALIWSVYTRQTVGPFLHDSPDIQRQRLEKIKNKFSEFKEAPIDFMAQGVRNIFSAVLSLPNKLLNKRKSNSDKTELDI